MFLTPEWGSAKGAYAGRVQQIAIMGSMTAVLGVDLGSSWRSTGAAVLSFDESG